MIQPRLDKLKPSQSAKRVQPPTPPKPNRWQERPQEKQTVQAPQEPTPQDPKGTQTTPQQVADQERQYMELQAVFAQMRQRTIAESRPTHPTQSQTSASLPAASPLTTGEADTALPSKSSTNAVTEAPVHQASHRPTLVIQPATSATVTACHTRTRDGYPGCRCVIHTLPSSRCTNRR